MTCKIPLTAGIFNNHSMYYHNVLNLVNYKMQFSCQFSCLIMSNSATPLTAARQASLSITNSRSLLRLFLSIESVMPSSHLILCRPLLLPSIFPSIRVFSSQSVLCIRWAKYWSFSFSIRPSNSSFPFFLFNVELLMYAIPYEKLFQLWVEKVIGREVTLI